MKLLIKYGLLAALVSLNLLTACSENNIITAYRWTRKEAEKAIIKGKDPVLEKLWEVDKKGLNKPLIMDTVHYNQNSSDYEITELQNGISPVACINGYLDMYKLLLIDKYGYPLVTNYEESQKIEMRKQINTKKYVLVQSLEKSAYGRLIECNIQEQHFTVEIKQGEKEPSEIILSIYKPSTTTHHWTCPLVNWGFVIGGIAAAYFAYHKWLKK